MDFRCYRRCIIIGSVSRIVSNNSVRIIRRCSTSLVEIIRKNRKSGKKHNGKASSHSTPFYPPMFFTMVVCGFLIILIADFTNGFGKQFRVHTNTSLSIKNCFIFWRIRVSRTDTFFSDIPTRFAMSA